MAGFLSTFSFVIATTIRQLKNSSNNENTASEKHYFLVVGLEKVLFREGNSQGNRKLRADPA